MTEKFTCPDKVDNADFNFQIILGWHELKPKMDDFISMYSLEEINADKAEMERIKKSPDYINQKTEAAIVAEYAVAQLIESEEIFSGDMSITMTSEFDDIKRGVDYIINCIVGDQTYKIGIDIKVNTYGRNDENVEKAIRRTLNEAMRDKMREIKYFIDPQTDKKEKIEVPVLVLVFVSKRIIEFRDIVAKKPKQRTTEEKWALRGLVAEIQKEIGLRCRDMIDAIEKMKTRSAELTKDKIIQTYSNLLSFLEHQQF